VLGPAATSGRAVMGQSFSGAVSSHASSRS
jgi:hypothetical protein